MHLVPGYDFFYNAHDQGLCKAGEKIFGIHFYVSKKKSTGPLQGESFHFQVSQLGKTAHAGPTRHLNANLVENIILPKQMSD